MSGPVREVSLVDAVMSETRRDIIVSIQDKPKHISAIAKELSLDRSTVSYHLNLLERVGIVTQEYKVIQPPESSGRVGSFFSVNNEVLKKAVELAVKALEIG